MILLCPSFRDYRLPEPPVELVDQVLSNTVYIKLYLMFLNAKYSFKILSVYSPNLSLNVNNNIIFCAKL